MQRTLKHPKVLRQLDAPDSEPSLEQANLPGLHVACVMDGNGRWAERQGLARSAGHREGAEAVRRIVEAAPELGVSALTLYAFSADNWRRPKPEVRALMSLLGAYVRAEAPRLKRAGVRLQIIGRRDRLPGALRSAICRAEWETRYGRRLLLRVAVDYSARWALREAAHRWAQAGLTTSSPTPEAFEGALAAALAPDGASATPVDLFLRTGGEQRLSDFLLWESAYAELLFLDTLWPDVTGDTLAEAVGAFHQRERRFGGLSASASPRSAA
ncbi:MAG: polyprenyl diphosphate synthase [Bacteroidota bacterium]